MDLIENSTGPAVRCSAKTGTAAKRALKARTFALLILFENMGLSFA
jgi:hypothetical protein